MSMTVDELKEIMVERFDALDAKIVRICEAQAAFGERCRYRHENVDERIAGIKTDIAVVNTRQNILNIIGSGIATALASLGIFLAERGR